MASELCTVVLSSGPAEHKQRTAETLEKYKSHLKLKPNTADGIFNRSLEKFNEYAVAVGWQPKRSGINGSCRPCQWYA